MNLDKPFFWMSREEECCALQALNRVLKFPIDMEIVRNGGACKLQVRHTIKKDEVFMVRFDVVVRTPRELLEYICSLEYNGQFLSPAMKLRLRYEEAYRNEFSEKGFATLKPKAECPICYEVIVQGFKSKCAHEVCVSCWAKLERCPLCREEYFREESDFDSDGDSTIL